MAGRLYSYEVAYGGPGLYAAPRTSTSADASLGDGLRYRGDYLAVTGYVAGRSSLGGVDSVLGGKRSVEDPYQSAILGSRTTYGKSEALLTTNPFTKRFRYECTSNLPNYPQRPGEKDCAHYMLTRSCNFGDNCKFNHPLWVPEGGISDWKELPTIPSLELPERPGEPDCPYFLKTNTCKFASNCKFNHPKGGPGSDVVSLLPERPNELSCAFYMKTGKCKFGAMCKFHHPKDIELPAQENATKGQNGSALVDEGAAAAISTPVLPAMFHNLKGLPLRPDQADCPFYLKTGSCKYGANCRYSHPDIYSISSSASSLGQAFPSSAATFHHGGVDNPASLLSYLNPHLTSTNLSLRPVLYPQRPDEIECSYYMKKRECKFLDKCKFHHPILPNPSVEIAPPTQSVRLSLAGLPRREDAATCAFYMKTGTCKFGANCKFDHPTPGEAIAKAAVETAASQPAMDTSKDTAAVSSLRAKDVLKGDNPFVSEL